MARDLAGFNLARCRVAAFLRRYFYQVADAVIEAGVCATAPYPIIPSYNHREIMLESSCVLGDDHAIVVFMLHDGERWCYGEARATGGGTSMVHQVVRERSCKPQQRQWTKHGAPLVLQLWVKTLHHELGSVCQRWYPDLQGEEMAEAA